MRRKTIQHIFISIFIFFSIVPASQLHVRINDPIYSYLERMATQGLLTDYLDNTLPLTRDYIAQQLLVLADKRDHLTGIDKKILDEYLADFRFELTEEHHPLLPPDRNTYFAASSYNNLRNSMKDIFSYDSRREEHHIVVYESKDEMLWMDLDEMVRYETKDGIGRFLTQNAFRLYSQVGERFSIYSDAYIYIQQVKSGFDEPAKEYKGGYWKDDEHVFNYIIGAFDYTNAYVNYSSGMGELMFGVEPIIWGNSRHSLILSNNTDPFVYLGWQKEIWKSKFKFIHGYINSSDETGNDTLAIKESAIKKYIVGHRWEIYISSKSNFAFSEMLIYGGRDPEVTYFVPIILLWPAQHAITRTRDDNLLWIFEGEYLPIPSLKLYGTFLFDEFTSPAEIFQSSWDNKFGIQCGIHFSQRKILGLSFISDLHFEFTAIRPWVYTHDYPQQSSYTNNGRSLGFYAGPNSQSLFFENRWWLSQRQKVKLSFIQLKHGINEMDPEDENFFPIGDNLYDNYRERNKKFDNSTRWLMGNIITSREFSINWIYQLSNIVFVDLGYSKRWDETQTDNYFSIQIRFDY